MIYIFDATVFFSEWKTTDVSLTTPEVVEELKDTCSRLRYEVFLAEGMKVREPAPHSRKRVQEAMHRSGDAGVLSSTDIGVLALALDAEGTVVTDDFALQNVAHRLGIPILSVHQRTARSIKWRYRCTGCGRYGKTTGSCPVCGSPMKRTIR
jgi:UPF0271 protein